MTRAAYGPHLCSFLLLALAGCSSTPEAEVPAAEDTGTVAVPDSATTDSGTVAEDAAIPDAPSEDAPAAPNSVLVYTINIENMIFDWQDLVHYMRSQPRNPDIVLIQQMTNKKRLDEFTAFMTKTLGESYDGAVAQNDPTHQRFQDEVKPNPQVTTGVIWRGARFNLLKTEKWFPWGASDGSGGHTCASRTGNSGYQTIRVELDDVLAKKRIAATSLRHWTWMDCSEKNMIEMVDGAAGHGPMPNYALQIVGGDFNGTAFDATGDYKCWYRVSHHALGGEVCAGHANLGYEDPLYAKCTGVKSCVSASSAIDFIFARTAGGKPARASGFDIVTYDDGNAADKAANGSDGLSNRTATSGFNDVNTNYSEHRARKAVFFYE